MNPKALVLCGLLVSLPVHAADRWAALWATDDQRGEQLLQQGDAAAAARTFSDPRHKAFAELQAGDYASAARDYGAFDDADAHYNRGNALTKGGQLEEALKAYDAALARKPDDADFRRNRDLVAKALSQSPPPPPKGQEPKGENSKQERDSKQSPDSKSADPSRPGKDSSDQADSKDGKKGESDPSAPNQSATADPQPSTDSTPLPKDPSSSSKGPSKAPAPSPEPADNLAKHDSDNPRSRPMPSADATAAPSPDSQKSGAEQAQDDEDQAKRDARAALASPSHDPKGASDAAQTTPVPAAPGESEPTTEKQLAQEQWLRQVPDDPSGLLRRKFMIEHLLRQQQNRAP